MTSAVPRDEDEGPDRESAAENPRSGADYDQAFALIVSGMKADMEWDTSALPDIDTPPAPTPPAVLGGPAPGEATPQDLERARRRRERAEQLAAFNAQKAETEAEYVSEGGHFVRPDPGPLPRLRSSTVTALLLIVLGLVLLIQPTLLSVPQDLTLILSIGMIIGGGLWLTSRLRKEPGPDDEWDNGARL